MKHIIRLCSSVETIDYSVDASDVTMTTHPDGDVVTILTVDVPEFLRMVADTLEP